MYGQPHFDFSVIIQFLILGMVSILSWIGANMHKKIDSVFDAVHSINIEQSAKFAEYSTRLDRLEKEIDEIKIELRNL